MPKRESSRERIYIRPAGFSLRLRALRRGSFEIEASGDFVYLFALGGSLRLASLEGSPTPDAQNQNAQLQPGSALFLAPSETLSASTHEPAELLQLTIAPTIVLDCAVRARLTRGDASITFSRNVVDEDDNITRVARDLADELRDDSAGRELVIASLVEQALVYSLRRYANIVRSTGLELSRAGLVDRRIRRAVELMHAQLERELPLEELAAAAHLSPFHFSRLFKKLTGATPHSYLATLRAARAQALLAESDLSMTEVAARVGYASSSHFSKAFRRATGLSPRDFRRALVRR